MPDMEKEILQQIDLWFAALADEDSRRVAELYSENAVLVPTLWNGPCFGRRAIQNYFEVAFKPLQPQGYLINYVVSCEADIATVSGHYVFVVKDCSHNGTGGSDDGDCDPKHTTKPARFTFVYKKDKTKWRIIAHHSSKMPEEHSTKASKWTLSEILA